MPRRRLAAIASVIACAFLVGLYVELLPIATAILNDPAAERLRVVGLVGTAALPLASLVLVRRDADRRWRSSIGLALLAGIIAYAIAGMALMVVGDYSLSPAPLALGLWGGAMSLLALAPAVVYVVYSDEPLSAVVLGVTSALLVTGLHSILGPCVAVLVYVKRGALNRIAGSA